MQAGRSLDSLLSAYRIGARVAWRRFSEIGVERRPRSRDAVRAGRVDLRLHRSAVGRVRPGPRRRTVGGGGRAAAAPAPARADPRSATRRRTPRPPPPRRPRHAGSYRDRWRRSRSGASIVSWSAARLPADVIVDAIGDDGVRLVPDPDGPGRRSELERAVRGARAQAGLGTTVRWQQAGSASPGRAPRSSWRRRTPGARLRPRQRRPAAARGRSAASRPSSPADRLAPLRELSPGSRRRLSGDARRCGWPNRAGSVGSPSGSASIRRPPATGSGACANCSEAELDDPEARFWLELALRVDALTEPRAIGSGGRSSRGRR